jgi:hypothetical protein
MARSSPGGAALHRPLGPPQPVQLGRQRSGAVLQVLQVAAAVERLTVDAARPAAPIAGLRGARIGVVRPWPAAASAALVEPRPGRDADLPGPTRLPAGHEVSPPLAWLPGSDQPTTQVGTAQPEPHGASTVLPGRSGLQDPVWARLADRKARRPAHSLPWRSPSPGGELRSKGRPSEADQTGVDSPLGAVLAARGGAQRAVRRLGATRP